MTVIAADDKGDEQWRNSDVEVQVHSRAMQELFSYVVLIVSSCEFIGEERARILEEEGRR